MPTNYGVLTINNDISRIFFFKSALHFYSSTICFERISILLKYKSICIFLQTLRYFFPFFAVLDLWLKKGREKTKEQTFTPNNFCLYIVIIWCKSFSIWDHNKYNKISYIRKKKNIYLQYTVPPYVSVWKHLSLYILHKSYQWTGWSNQKLHNIVIFFYELFNNYLISLLTSCYFKVKERFYDLVIVLRIKFLSTTSPICSFTYFTPKVREFFLATIWYRYHGFFSWYLYKMVAQNMFRTYEVK